MDPIGASSSWRWFGYENSWVVLDGSLVQSVSGGAHWGGGMFINAYDMGRFGYLTLRHGKWKDRQLISNQRVDWTDSSGACWPRSIDVGGSRVPGCLAASARSARRSTFR